MATIVTRVAKGSPLTHVEVDTNFTNLNTAKLETLAGTAGAGTAAAPSISFAADVNTGLFNPAADTLAASTAGINRLHITSGGLVGIGTSAPTEKLTINGNVAFNTNDQFIKFNAFHDNPFIGSMGSILAFNSGYGSEVAAINFFQTGGNIADIIFRTGGAGSSVERMRINSTGNVGIGTTSPATILHVNGDVTITDKIIHGGDTNTAIRFPAADTVSVETNGTERARIDSSGRLLVGTSTAAATGGVLQLSSGITFPATAVASANVNTLDDYEEGTWTPTFGGTTTNPTVAYGTQVGTYTKIGNLVTVFFKLSISAASGGTGFLVIAGLPFTVNADVSECGGLLGIAQNITGATGYGGIQQSGGNTFAYLMKNNLNAGGSYFIPTDLTNATTCRGTFSYIV